MKVQVKNYHDTPTVWVDGQPVTGLMSWNRYPSVEDTALFRDAGLQFYSFMGNLFVPNDSVPDEELDVHDGALDRMRMTAENIDRTMSMLLSVNPQLKVLPRIILNAPVWWLKQHPDDVMVRYDVNTRRYEREPRPNFAAESWRKVWTAALAETVAYFEQRWSEYIIGYHVGMGHCGEHTYHWWDNICDFSPAQAQAFRRWLSRQYPSVDDLNRRWRSDYPSFDQVPLPDAVRFCDYTVRARSLLLPESESDMIDFQKFSSDIVADTILQEADTVKRTLERLGREKLVGIFYGYINLVGNSTQTTAGHSALTKVLRSPNIDFICGPLSYGARQNGGTVMPQIIPGSILAHGKFFYNEDDTGTHVVPRSHHGYIPATEEDSIHAERRNFMETWRSGGSQWWMDLYGVGWFLDEGLCKEFSTLRQFAEDNLANRESCAQIAVFVSLRSTFYMRDNPVPMTGNLIEQQLFEIGAIGASFDIFQEEDIELLATQEKLKQYKFCIFLNNLAPDEKLRGDIAQYLQNSGRTLLWFYLPGYIRNRRCSAEFSRELTGIQFAAVGQGIMPMLTETRLGSARISYGLTRAVYPRLTANDPQAETLGYYVNGTTIVNRENGDGAALVCKDMGNWCSIWSSSPGLPSSLLGCFAREAGVHLYSECGDQVFRARNWFGIHAKFDGKRIIPFEQNLCFTDLFSGETTQGNTLELGVKRGETKLYKLQQYQ